MSYRSTVPLIATRDIATSVCAFRIFFALFAFRRSFIRFGFGLGLITVSVFPTSDVIVFFSFIKIFKIRTSSLGSRIVKKIFFSFFSRFFGPLLSFFFRLGIKPSCDIYNLFKLFCIRYLTNPSFFLVRESDISSCAALEVDIQPVN